jgi:hypothetical protein
MAIRRSARTAGRDEPAGRKGRPEGSFAILGRTVVSEDFTRHRPWMFIVLRDRADLERLAELAPNGKHVVGAAAAIALAMPGENPEWDAYDEGRVAERILIAATALGLGAGIGWAVESKRAGVSDFLGLTPPAPGDGARGMASLRGGHDVR